MTAQANSQDQAATALQTLTEFGYCKIKNLIPKPTTEILLSKIKKIHQGRAELPADQIPYLNKGHFVAYNLQNDDPQFLRIFLHEPVIRKVLISALNDPWYKQIPPDHPNFILRSMLARSGGHEALPLHIDSFIPSSGSWVWAAQVAIVLEEQTHRNGCTVFVPGSHRSDRYATQDAIASAVPVSSNPGDVVIWDSRTWHGTKPNSQGTSRWALISTFGRWWIKQNYNIPKALPESIYAELSAEEKAVLGFCSFPPESEYQRVDIKTGFDALKPTVSAYKL